MKPIDALGKPCPIPVIEAKKALAEQETTGVLVRVDNIVAVQNLEKMAGGYGYVFSYTTNAADSFEVTISKDGKAAPEVKPAQSQSVQGGESSGGLVVVISKNTMGQGSEELGAILIKGFIYSLTELPTLPQTIIFFNSGAFLTSDGANTINDLKAMEESGAEILTCGTCANFYELQDKLAVGSITNMYVIAEKMATAAKVINI